MFDAFLNRQPGRPWYRILWWHLLHFLCFVWFWSCYRYRAWGVNNIPATGPVLLVSNHQSFLDPIIVGLAAHRRQFYAMARATLWETPVLGRVIDSLNAVSVARGESDLKAIRQCLNVLKQNHALLIFPEGTRSPDGSTQTFESGTMLLIKRSGATIVPVAVEGAQTVWPKGRKFPKLTGQLGASYGQPIDAKTLTAMPAHEAITLLRDRVETQRLDLAQKLQHHQPGGDRTDQSLSALRL